MLFVCWLLVSFIENAMQLLKEGGLDILMKIMARYKSDASVIDAPCRLFYDLASHNGFVFVFLPLVFESDI